jgi:hypothetical protein
MSLNLTEIPAELGLLQNMALNGHASPHFANLSTLVYKVHECHIYRAVIIFQGPSMFPDKEKYTKKP